MVMLSAGPRTRPASHLRLHMPPFVARSCRGSVHGVSLPSSGTVPAGEAASAHVSLVRLVVVVQHARGTTGQGCTDFAGETGSARKQLRTSSRRMPRFLAHWVETVASAG